MLISVVPPPSGGIATWTLSYLKYCADENIPCELVNTAVIGKRINNLTGELHILDEIRRVIGILNRIRKINFGFKPEIAHINTNCSKRGIFLDWLCAKTVSSFNIPYVIHCRCNIRDQIGSNQLSNKCLEKLVLNAKRIIVLNEESREYLETIFGVHSVIISNFIGNEQDIKESKTINEYIKKVCYIGHIRSGKGFWEFAKVAKSYPGIEFVAAGQIMERIQDEKLPQNMVLTGEVNHAEVLRILDGSDVFMFLTHTEGFSNSLLEAMARGVPCIATNVGANLEMLESKGGVIVPPEDDARILNALDEVMPAKKRYDMSKWNIKKVKDKYTVNITMKSILEVYEDVKHDI